EAGTEKRARRSVTREASDSHGSLRHRVLLDAAMLGQRSMVAARSRPQTTDPSVGSPWHTHRAGPAAWSNHVSISDGSSSRRDRLDRLGIADDPVPVRGRSQGECGRMKNECVLCDDLASTGDVVYEDAHASV